MSYGDGCIGAGDEQEDGGVIQNAEERLYPGLGEGVIERGCQIEGDHRGAVDAKGYYLPNIALTGGEYHLIHQCRNGKPYAGAVGDAIGNLFSQALFLTEGYAV